LRSVADWTILGEAGLASGKSTYQHTTPLFVDRLELSGTARALDRLSFAVREHDERWLQRLIYRFPQLLPVREIEPAFGSLVPVCIELPTPVGSIDNLYVTGTGNLAIAECKLWKNPEARRQVVAQIIDYAHSMARWGYKELESAIRSGTRPDDEKISGGLFSLVSEDSELDEPAFGDAVSRNLRLGRILLLIVGDGIKEGVETLTEYLQMHAGFHFTLGIVEMAVFRLPPEGFLVQPRILARTVNIERGIVRLSDEHVRIEPLEDDVSRASSTRRTSISEDQLFESLAVAAPLVGEALNRFLKDAEELGVFVEPATKSLQIRWRGPDDVAYGLGGIDEKGRLLTNSINWKPSLIGRVNLAHGYLDRLAALIGGRVRQTKKAEEWYVIREGSKGGFLESLPQAMDLLARSSEWLEIIRWYTGELRSAIEAESA
jgi:hypothetical protein